MNYHRTPVIGATYAIAIASIGADRGDTYMAGSSRHSPISKVILIAEMLIGGIAVAASLWTGKGIAAIYGSGIYLIDRIQHPLIYWGGLIAILLGLVAYPLWCLYKGPPKY
ncbi:hypothetical protein NKH55_27435 [Mesorhizobium opportunistum]|uniref:hypothetical protein n=1 Tax=Mesorhizobium opportunistum TaxID=593909 RepID=UPI003334B27B